MIRFAVIGIGGYARQLIQAMEDVSDAAGCKLVAAAVRNPDKYAERVAALREAGVEIFTDATEMLRELRGRCEAVYIPTGIHSHMPLTLTVAEAGYHIHLEKPAAGTVQEVDAMLEGVNKTDRMCLVGFQAVHGDDVRFVKDVLASGRLGTVRTLACEAGWPRPASYYHRNSWAGKLRIRDKWVLDGPAMNALAHQINNMLYWASAEPTGYAEPVRVRAELYATEGLEAHDTAGIEIETAEGPKAYFLGSHRTAESFDPAIHVVADGGRVEWHYNAGVTVTYADGTEETRPGDTQDKQKMVAHFAEAIRDEDPSKLGCDLAGSRQMVLALNGAHDSSVRIYGIAGEHTRRRDAEDDDHYTIIEGLDEHIRDAARAAGLFSDLPAPPPWATRTDPFDLRGYDGFPARFQRA